MKEKEIQEKKEYLTPLKKKAIELKKNNIILNKPKNKPHNKKVILDDEEESENPDVEMEVKEAGKQKGEKEKQKEKKVKMVLILSIIN